MSKRSFVIAFLVSLMAHIIFLLPWTLSTPTSELTDSKVARKARVTLPARSASAGERIAGEPHSGRAAGQNKDMQKLQEIVNPRETVSALSKGDFSSKQSEADVPVLRLSWAGPDELIAVAKDLGMRILAVKADKVVSELSLGVPLILKAFDGTAADFSNRIRALPATFFGPAIVKESEKSIDCFWVLVPDEIDRHWISVQQKAIQSRGLQNSQIIYMKAKVEWRNQGYELVITRIIKT